MRYKLACVALAAALVSAPVHAQHVQAYFYDALGRLQASTSAHDNLGYRTRYVFDPAGNRTSVGSEYTGFRAQPDRISGGEALLPGQKLVSADGRFTFILQQGDGNAVIYGPNGAIWASGTASGKSTLLAMQSDGQLVLYGSANEVLWARGAPSPNTRLIMQNDGNLVIYSNNTATWASNTSGQ